MMYLVLGKVLIKRSYIHTHTQKAYGNKWGKQHNKRQAQQKKNKKD